LNHKQHNSSCIYLAIIQKTKKNLEQTERKGDEVVTCKTHYSYLFKQTKESSERKEFFWTKTEKEDEGEWLHHQVLYIGLGRGWSNKCNKW
jgi:hypothetical protein